MSENISSPLCCNANIPPVFQDLEYWGIDELLLEPCCALKYYPEIELCVKVMPIELSPWACARLPFVRTDKLIVTRLTFLSFHFSFLNAYCAGDRGGGAIQAQVAGKLNCGPICAYFSSRFFPQCRSARPPRTLAPRVGARSASSCGT